MQHKAILASNGAGSCIWYHHDQPILEESMGRRATLWILSIVLCLATPLWAQHEHSAHEADPQAVAHAAADMAKAANNLLATYTPEQKQAGVFEVTSDERVNWHFIPRTRKGI